jgi:dTDP-4-dehydrorhamnose reductase
MKVAVTGAAGLFGFGLAQVFAKRHEVHRLTRADADITDAAQVRRAIERISPEVIVHAAAIPDLDLCEDDPARAFQVNVHGTRNVAEAAQVVGATVACISTDAVFDGKKTAPYAEEDRPNPPTVYGRTKLRGERIVQSLPPHWIFRVSVLFGPGKPDFVDKGLRKIAAGENYTVAADQVATATYTVDAAEKIMEVVEARRYGLYHMANTGVCSRLDLARRAAELAGLDPERVRGLPSDQMGRRAPRLKYAVMELGRLKREGFALPRPWQEALAEYVRGVRL